MPLFSMDVLWFSMGLLILLFHLSLVDLVFALGICADSLWASFVPHMDSLCVSLDFLPFLSDELYSFFNGVSVVSYDFPLFLYSFL